MAASSPVPTSALIPPRTTLVYDGAFLGTSSLNAASSSPTALAPTESGEEGRLERHGAGGSTGTALSASPERMGAVVVSASEARIPGEMPLEAAASPESDRDRRHASALTSPPVRTPRSSATRDSDETIVPSASFRSPPPAAAGPSSLTRSSAIRRASGADAPASPAPASAAGPSSSGSRRRHRPVPLELGPAGRPGASASASTTRSARASAHEEDMGLLSPSPIGGLSRAFVLGGPDERDDLDAKDLPTPMSFASSGADSDRIISDLHKLDILGQTVRQNLINRPVTGADPRAHLSASPSASGSRLGGSPEDPAVDTGGSSPASLSWSLSASGHDTSGQSSPLSAIGDALRLPRTPEQVISPAELLALVQEQRGPDRPRLLILDVRPMPPFLVSHLPHSANVVIPSMILRRCRASAGDKWQGGWGALRGFISTEGGRDAWHQAMEGAARDVTLVLLSSSERKEDAAMADTVEVLVRKLATDAEADPNDTRHITVRWLVGGWADGVKPNEAFKPLFREGEKSHKTRSSSQSRAGNLPPFRVPPPIEETTASDGIMVATPSDSLTQSPGIFASGMQAGLGAPPPRKTPVHHPSLPALHLYPDSNYAPPPLISPGFEASRSAKRQPPRPSPINTAGLGRRNSSNSNGPELSSISEPGRTMRPPKLSLNTGAVPLPLKSASLGSASPWVPLMGNPSPPRKNKGPGLTLTINKSAHDDAVPPSPRKPFHPSIHAAAHAQSRMPPSPSSFGGITRRLRQSSTPPEGSPASSPSGMTARPDFGHQPSSYFRSPSGDAAYATSPGYANDDDREDPHRDSPPFIVSTVLPQFLYLGPEITTEADVQKLKEMGIKRILNVALECNDAEALRIPDRFEKYVQLPLRDIVEETGIAKGVRDACTFLDDARLHSAPTYVHCKAGKSRSVTVVLAYLIHANAWTLKTAYAYVAERRRGISPNIGFVAELMAYEETELGLKASSGVIEHEPSEPQSSLPGSPAGSKGRKSNRYARESLPPAWNSSNMDAGATSNKLTIGMDATERSPRPATSADRTPRPDDSPSRGEPDVQRTNYGQSGQEKEVRRDGQYVHFRRAPVDEHTLQPMRRVSKAGLESLRGMASPQPSPSLASRDSTRTPATERQGWL